MAAESTAPAAFGRYVVLERLGHGGMGAVYLARDESLGREVAVKVLRPLIAVGDPTPDMVERFRREARAIALLTHPSIVRIYDQGLEGGVPYLVMELCAGRTLAERIKAEGPLPVRDVRTLGIQIASALGAAHAAGVVHRDVKPSNVLQAGEGAWKLADFGIAHTSDSSLTITGQFLGTPAFAPPEALHGKPSGAAGDVYSLGATLYAALVGEPPFAGENFAQVAVSIATRRAAPIAERRADVPPSVAAAVERALSPDPQARPSAAELAQALAMGEQAAVTPLPAPAAATAPASAHSPRRYLPIAIGAAVVLLLIAIATSGSDDRSPSTSPLASPVAAPPPATSAGAPPALPPELGGGRHGKPSPAEKQWRKAIEKIQDGEWGKAEEELSKILARDPSNSYAIAWLEWVERAARSEEED